MCQVERAPFIIWAVDHQPIVSPRRALNAFSCIFAADLHGTGILVNSVGPGWVATDMGGRGGRPVEDGAKGIVWAATLPDNGPSGGSFFDGKPAPW